MTDTILTTEPTQMALQVEREADKEDIVRSLVSYKAEAEQNRKGGMNPRDDRWKRNLDLYWNRYDFSRKADWQAKEVMPEVPTYVDRFAAALKEALVATPEGFYTVIDPADEEGDLTNAVKRLTDVWLSTIGRNQMGQIISFPAVFEEQMKLGALMACSAVVTWKRDSGKGRVAMETVDPQMVWLDHTYRNLYRIRRIEVDRHELANMARQKDSKGKPIFNMEEIAGLTLDMSAEDQAAREALTGHGHEAQSLRKPIVLDEYIATVVNAEGKVLADKAMMVVADDKYLLRGPEKNPFWHKKDWLLYTPLITAPLSPYGRSYMEDMGDVASTFNKLTNLLLDAVYQTSLKAYAMVPSMLMNPQQAVGGIHGGKVFMLDEGFRAEDFAKALDLGTLPPGAVQVWQLLKQQLSEGFGINEIGLGQFAPNSRTSATEISATQQSSSALIRSVANTVETRWLDLALDLTWKTGLQHASPDDPMLAAAAGEEMYRSLMLSRKELASRPMTFQARGISAMIQKQQQLQALLQMLGIFAQSEPLMAEFLKQVDMNKLMMLLFKLHNVDPMDIRLSQREQMIRQIVEPMQQAAQGAEGASPGGQQEVSQAVSQLGIGR